MPDVTDTFAIPFPCEGEVVTVPTITSYALGVEAALTTVWADATAATEPPAAAVTNNSGQTLATGVTSILTFTSEFYDRGGFWTIASPTLLTIPSAGSYFIASTSSVNLTGNVTSVRWAILRNAVEIAYWESQNTGVFIPASGLGVSVLAVACNPGDQITTTALYTGTQPTLSFFNRVNITKLSIF